MFYRIGKKSSILFVFMVFLCSGAAAQENKTGFVDEFGGSLNEFDEKAGSTFFHLFPNFEKSLNHTTDTVDGFLPFMKDYHWVVYLLIFFVLVGLLIKVWEESSNYLVNSLLGVILLITCIHLLGMNLKVTVLSLTVTLILGVPGVLVILALHYLGVTL